MAIPTAGLTRSGTFQNVPGVFADKTQQPQMPAQGGKSGGRPMQPQMPAQGGKGVPRPYTPIGAQPQVPAMGGKGGFQQPQMPAQGPFQNVPGVFPGPQPRVQQPLVQQPQVMPLQPQVQQPQVQQPLVTPARDLAQNPAAYQAFLEQHKYNAGPGALPQVLPARPMPANMAPQGLMGLQQTLAGQRLAPGQSAPAPGLNGVPGNQNPLYFGPGYR